MKNKFKKWVEAETSSPTFETFISEFLPLGEGTSFYGNYIVEGKECCQMTVSFRRGIEEKNYQYALTLSGTDDYSVTKIFEKSEEVNLFNEIAFLRRMAKSEGVDYCHFAQRSYITN